MSTYEILVLIRSLSGPDSLVEAECLFDAIGLPYSSCESLLSGMKAQHLVRRIVGEAFIYYSLTQFGKEYIKDHEEARRRDSKRDRRDTAILVVSILTLLAAIGALIVSIH